MTSLFRTLLPRAEERFNDTATGLTVTDWALMQPGQQFTYGGQTVQAYRAGVSGGGASYDRNAIVFACEAKRLAVFSEARFQFQRLANGRPGDLFGTADLSPLYEPWPGATSRDLLNVCEINVLEAGNSYWVKGEDEHLIWLDPSKVKVITTAYLDPVSGNRVGEQLAGYAYYTERDKVTIYDPKEIAHYKPIPNRSNRFIGASWLSACLPDVGADDEMTAHKVTTLSNGTEIPYAVTLDKDVSPVQLEAFAQKFREQHEGITNAGKTVFLGGGADIKTIGQDWESLNLQAVQASGETRIAACAGTPPALVGLTEGLKGSTLNEGNYASAKRAFADTVIRPLWGAWCGAFQWLINTPSQSRLWYDDRDIAFLREDVTDQAEILSTDSTSINALITAGFDPDAVIDAVTAGDPRRLKGHHTGLYSVQLQKPLALTEFPDAQKAPTQQGATA